jgi:hypothetical protein
MSTNRRAELAALPAAVAAAHEIDQCARYQHDWDDRNYEPPVCTQCGLVWKDPEPGGTRQPREGDEMAEIQVEAFTIERTTIDTTDRDFQEALDDGEDGMSGEELLDEADPEWQTREGPRL